MKDRLQSAECAKRLRALANPDRLKIIQCLLDGPKAVGNLAELLGVAICKISHHARTLYHASLVIYERRGHCVVYSLRPDISRSIGIINLGCCRLHLGQCRK
jgi:ArsR family transcriptional regulator, nickel/cobalt-responsive transcriptional repressor